MKNSQETIDTAGKMLQTLAGHQVSKWIRQLLASSYCLNMFEPLFIVFNHIICLDLGKIREKFTRKPRLKFSNASTDKQGFC